MGKGTSSVNPERLSVSNQRDYDPWGNIRGGATSGDPKGRYCASLGHKQDDESGLVYMRARYYEPTSGRFVTEDPSRNCGNWFVYCSDEPVSNVDCDGRSAAAIAFGVFVAFALAYAACLTYGYETTGTWDFKGAFVGAALSAAITGLALLVTAVAVAASGAATIAIPLSAAAIGTLALCIVAAAWLGLGAGMIKNWWSGTQPSTPVFGGLVGLLADCVGENLMCQAYLMDC